MTRLLILGGSGMLGHKLWQIARTSLETFATVRSASAVAALGFPQHEIIPHESMAGAARSMLASSRHDLLFIHFAIPHSPHIYNLKEGDLTETNDLFHGYVGNLRLIDRTFGNVRRTVERSGTWDSAAVIVTSDHWCRYSTRIDGKSDHRVPFLVKMPGQGDGVNYETTFNTIVLHDMVNAIFHRELIQASELKPWLDRHGRAVPAVEAPGFD
jgi:arylsulfatase A-like enzyme